MDNELERKMNDLAASALKKQRYVAGKFLTPAEQAQVRKMRFYAGVSLSFAGGAESCERCIPVFFPDYLENEEPDYTEFLRAVKISSSGSGFTHRDVLGAVLATGIERECVGDITVMENDAYVYLLPAAQANVLSVLISVGRNHVTVSGIDLDQVPTPEIKTESRFLTVASIRLDVIVAGVFSVSRSDAVKAIKTGIVSVNYLPELSPDKHLNPGDMISFRGKGKGVFTEVSGMSKKGRCFIKAERYL